MQRGVSMRQPPGRERMDEVFRCGGPGAGETGSVNGTGATLDIKPPHDAISLPRTSTTRGNGIDSMSPSLFRCSFLMRGEALFPQGSHDTAMSNVGFING